MKFLSIIASKTLIHSRKTVFEKWFALHTAKMSNKISKFQTRFLYTTKTSIIPLSMTDATVCHLFLEIRILSFFLISLWTKLQSLYFHQVHMCNKIWCLFSLKWTITTAY